MKTLIYILLISTLIYGKELYFSKSEIENIKNNKSKNAISIRIQNYYKLKKKIKHYTMLKKISHINSFYNKILPQYDKQKYGISDYWSTPKEFLISGRGDCEDYAIAKYFSLLENGFDKDKTFLAIVKVEGKASEHMVLLYFQTKESIPYVLDNLSFKVLPLNKRKKLNIKFIFNEKDSFLMKDYLIYKKVRINWGEENKWGNLLTKVYEKNE